MAYHNPQKHKNRYPARCKSGLKGVIYRAWLTHKPWQAYIRHHGQFLGLGYIATKLETAKAYNLAAIRLKGRDAYFNPLIP
jgi:hypothetical protein